MKKFLAIILVIIIGVSLVACGSAQTISPIHMPHLQTTTEETTISVVELPEETTAPEEVETTIPAQEEKKPTKRKPSTSTSSGTKPQETKPTETIPTPTEPEETTTPAPTEPEETIPTLTEPAEPEETTPSHTLITKTKTINGMVVKYLACGICEKDTIHENKMWGSVFITRKIQSITVMNNDVCKIVLIPKNDGLTKWECRTTNNTDEQLHLDGAVVPSILNPGEIKERTFIGSIEDITIMSGEYQKGDFTPDGRINKAITVDMEEIYGG